MIKNDQVNEIEGEMEKKEDQNELKGVHKVR